MSYFKPWRRKVGVVTLVLACVFTAGWVRSRVFSDALMFQADTPRESVSNSLISCEKGLVWIRRFRSNEDTDLFAFATPPPSWFTFHHGLPSDHPFATQLYDGSIWKSYWKGYVWKWYGIRLDASDERHRDNLIRLCVIPYWSLVLPLALLSVYLLLRKPRPAKSKP